MEEQGTTAVFLIPEEVAQFIIFRQHYDIFSVLIDKKIFDIRNGSVALHFDANGTLQTVQRADILYSRRFES